MQSRAMAKRREFKRHFSRLLLSLVFFNAVLAFAVLLTREKAHLYVISMFFIGMNTFYVVSIMFKPFKIIVDEVNSVLETHYLLGLRKNQVVPLPGIECTLNNKEAVARGGKVMILRIKHADKIIAELLPNGWSETTLAEIFRELESFSQGEIVSTP